MKNLKKIKGDASFRKFFRKKNKNNYSIIVYAKKEKFKNLITYDAINQILNKNRVLAPTMYYQNYRKNYIEIQDFGNETIFKILIKTKKKFFYFKKVIGILNKIQLIKDRKIKNFKKRIYKVPSYNKEIIIKEANLFCEWYVKLKLSKKDRFKFTKKYKMIIKKLVSHIKLKNNVFVHRDFHISNLMLVNDQIGVIDTQDALIGNKAYDLASFIDDVRFKTSNKFKEQVYNYYLKKNKQVKLKKFKTDFEILSVLRNFKIIGIFVRLGERDNKKKYLKLIPYAWKMIEYRANKNKIFNNLIILIKKNSLSY